MFHLHIVVSTIQNVAKTFLYHLNYVREEVLLCQCHGLGTASHVAFHIIAADASG